MQQHPVYDHVRCHIVYKSTISCIESCQVSYCLQINDILYRIMSGVILATNQRHPVWNHVRCHIVYKSMTSCIGSCQVSYFYGFSGGRSWSSQRKPPIMGKQLVNFITCDCESSAPFFVIYKARHEPTSYW